MNQREELDIVTLLMRIKQINKEQVPEHWLWDRVITCDLPRITRHIKQPDLLNELGLE